MSSDVDICNLALAHIGDAANVQSISPPDGSVQAALCATFYPLTRDALLEMHDWGFAARRVSLSVLTTNPASTWAYCYAAPNDLLNANAILAPDAQDDVSTGLTYASPTGYAMPYPGMGVSTPYGSAPAVGLGIYAPQPFVCESTADGEVIYTNQVNAVLRYTSRLTDPARYSPLFVTCLSLSLAAHLAGPIIKGEAGRAEAARLTAMAFGRDGKSGALGAAVASDAAQKRSTGMTRQQVPWMVAR